MPPGKSMSLYVRLPDLKEKLSIYYFSGHFPSPNTYGRSQSLLTFSRLVDKYENRIAFLYELNIITSEQLGIVTIYIEQYSIMITIPYPAQVLALVLNHKLIRISSAWDRSIRLQTI